MNKKDFFKLPENAKNVFKGNRWSVWQWEQKLFDGGTATFETIKRADTIIVIPVLPDGRVVIQEEQQAHWDKPYFSFTAGGAEEGESPIIAARRETKEEIGMAFKNFHLVSVDEFLPGVLWKNYTFIASGFEKNILQACDGGEKINPKIISKEELIQMTINKSFRYEPKFVEKFILQNKVNDFFDILKNPKKYEINLN